MAANIDSNLNCDLGAVNCSSNTFQTGTSTNADYVTGWTFWRDYYYPQVIRESYPVYVQEKAKDKGKQAFEIVKVLKDKKIIKLDKVSDFIDVMDELIKIL